MQTTMPIRGAGGGWDIRRSNRVVMSQWNCLWNKSSEM